MDIEIIVVPLLALIIFGLLGLSLNRLRRWLGKDISVKPIYLRSYGNLSEGELNLNISNNSGHGITINAIIVGELNGKGVREIGKKVVKSGKPEASREPFELGNKNYISLIINLEGELQEGKNNGQIILAVEDFRGRRRLVKKFSVFSEPRLFAWAAPLRNARSKVVK